MPKNDGATVDVSASKTDELIKSDMQAVLSRTHLSITLYDFLVRIFETVSNAMHGIQAKFGEKDASEGKSRSSLRTPTILSSSRFR